jgi:hypothetical protein
MKNFFAVIFLFLAALASNAQGTLRGKITDEKGENMYGVIVRAVENYTIRFRRCIFFEAARFQNVHIEFYHHGLSNLRRKNSAERGEFNK